MSNVFPGSTLRPNRPADPAVVKKVQDELTRRGLLQPPAIRIYDAATVAAVRHFQSVASDSRGEPLAIDGEVGPISWNALFGSPGVTFDAAVNPGLADAVIAFAQHEAEEGIRETSPNRGLRVDEYISFVGLDPAGGYDWCACFLQFCFHEGAQSLGLDSPMPFRGNTSLREPGAQNLWRLAKTRGTPRLTREEALADPGQMRPASVFVLDRGGGFGHVGLVVGWDQDRLVTIEGNTSPDAGGPSNGVYRRTNRRISQISFGFIQYC